MTRRNYRGPMRRLTLLLGLLATCALLAVACSSPDEPSLATETTQPVDGGALDNDTSDTADTLDGTDSITDAGDAEVPIPGAADGTEQPDGTSTEVDLGPIAEPTEVPPTAVPTPSPADCTAQLSNAVLVGQLLMPIAPPSDYPSVIQLAADGKIGAVALLGTPSATDVTGLDANLASASPNIPVYIAADEEGGRVQRLSPALEALPSAQFVAANMTAAEAEAMYANYANQAAGLGLDIVFGPVVDVGFGPGIGDRSYSDDPATVTAYAGAAMTGWQAAGVVPTLKHFPGHGKASLDTHDGIASVPPLDQLRLSDLVPYQTLLNQGPTAVMVAHLNVAGLTEDGIPTSLSPAAITNLLRNELGFDGIIITDALGMGAITALFSQADATVMAINAGADLAILDSVLQVDTVRERVLGAAQSGEIDRTTLVAAANRVLALKGVDPCAIVDTGQDN